MVTAEWVDAVGSILSGLSVAIGLWFAGRQLRGWHSETLHKRAAEIAEELLVSVYQVSESLRALRSPFDSVPEEQKDNKKYIYEARYKRFQDHTEDFRTLRLRQIRAKAFLSNKELYNQVDVLFTVRHKVITAIQMLADLDGWYDREDQDTRKLERELRADMWGSYGERDVLGVQQDAAVVRIEEILLPIIRMERASA